MYIDPYSFMHVYIDDLSDSDDLFMNEVDEDAVYRTPEDVLGHIYDDFQYDYTQHSCELLNGKHIRVYIYVCTYVYIYTSTFYLCSFINVLSCMYL